MSVFRCGFLVEINTNIQMANMKNRITLIGRVGQAPESKTFDSGKMRCQFSLATHEKIKSTEGAPREDTQWHSIVLWGPMAQIAESYLRKGDLCALEGKLVYRSYEDAQGQTVYRTEILGNDLQLLSPKSSEMPKE